MEASPNAAPFDRYLKLVGPPELVGPPAETVHPEPLALEDGFFEPATYHRVRGSLTRQVGRLAELPEELVRLGVDLGEIAWKQTRRAKVEAFSRNEREAIELVAAEHFAGFKRAFVPFQSEHGNKYELAAMEWEGRNRPEHEMVWIHGWFGRFESFAEQAHPERAAHLREFSHLMYNRPGTDHESANLVKEPGYEPQDHMVTNVLVLERLLDRSVGRGREEFTLVGHSFGGILTQTFLDYAIDNRPDLYDRIKGVILTNTTAERNVVKGSFLDEIPGTAPLIRSGIERTWQGFRKVSALHQKVMRREPLSLEITDQELTDRIKEIMHVVMTVGYFDSMVGGQADREVYLASKGRAKQNDRLAMVYDGLAMLRIDERQNVGRIKKPIAVVVGGHDQLLPDTGHAVAAQYAARRDHRTREFYFPASGHYTPMDRARVFNSLAHRMAEDPAAVLRLGTRRQYRQRAVQAAE